MVVVSIVACALLAGEGLAYSAQECTQIGTDQYYTPCFQSCTKTSPEQVCTASCRMKAISAVSGLTGCDTGSTGGTGTAGSAAAAPVTTITTAASGGWTWNTYTGTSSWTARVTEDESDCNGQVYESDISIGIKHSGKTARVTDFGHGAATGTFTSGNVLSFPSRIIDDPPGKTRLESFDVTFTPDCSLFTGGYGWHYAASDGTCSGFTKLIGRNDNSAGCPVPKDIIDAVVPLFEKPWAIEHQQEIATANSDLTEYLKLTRQESLENDARLKDLKPKVEAEYTKILTADPNNYFANMDMAELKKSQGKWDEYSYYIQKSLSNPSLNENTREYLKYDLAVKNGFPLTDLPAPGKSPLLQKMNTEGSTIRTLYGNDYSKNADDPVRWSLTRWATFVRDTEVTDIVPTVINR